MGARGPPPMSESPALLFVYGTLRRDARHPMHEVLARHAVLAGEASVPGRLHDLGAHPGAVPSADGSRVRGELYALRESAPVLAALDAYEGYVPESVEQRLFVRAVVEATPEDGDAVPAWIYWYASAIPPGSLIASGDWLARCVGARRSAT